MDTITGNDVNEFIKKTQNFKNKKVSEKKHGKEIIPKMLLVDLPSYLHDKFDGDIPYILFSRYMHELDFVSEDEINNMVTRNIITTGARSKNGAEQATVESRIVNDINGMVLIPTCTVNKLAGVLSQMFGKYTIPLGVYRQYQNRLSVLAEKELVSKTSKDRSSYKALSVSYIDGSGESFIGSEGIPNREVARFAKAQEEEVGLKDYDTV